MRHDLRDSGEVAVEREVLKSVLQGRGGDPEIVRRDRSAGALKSAYLFLRNLIDALRIVRGDASDLVLPAESSEEFKSLARRLGYRERDRSKGAAVLAGNIRQSMTNVHEYFVSRFEKKGN